MSEVDGKAMEAALLPCPFCGCAEIEQKYDNEIRCTNFQCDTSMHWGHFTGPGAKAAMASAWNTRAYLSASPAQSAPDGWREAVEKAIKILDRNLGHQTEKCYDAIPILRKALSSPPKIGEEDALHAAIDELRKVWFAGVDLDLPVISQACLTLFSKASELKLSRLNGAAGGDGR